MAHHRPTPLDLLLNPAKLHSAFGVLSPRKSAFDPAGSFADMVLRLNPQDLSLFILALSETAPVPGRWVVGLDHMALACGRCPAHGRLYGILRRCVVNRVRRMEPDDLRLAIATSLGSMASSWWFDPSGHSLFVIACGCLPPGPRQSLFDLFLHQRFGSVENAHDSWQQMRSMDPQVLETLRRIALEMYIEMPLGLIGESPDAPDARTALAVCLKGETPLSKYSCWVQDNKPDRTGYTEAVGALADAPEYSDISLIEASCGQARCLWPLGLAADALVDRVSRRRPVTTASSDLGDPTRTQFLRLMYHRVGGLCFRHSPVLHRMACVCGFYPSLLDYESEPGCYARVSGRWWNIEFMLLMRHADDCEPCECYLVYVSRCIAGRTERWVTADLEEYVCRSLGADGRGGVVSSDRESWAGFLVCWWALCLRGIRTPKDTWHVLVALADLPSAKQNTDTRYLWWNVLLPFMSMADQDRTHQLLRSEGPPFAHCRLPVYREYLCGSILRLGGKVPMVWLSLLAEMPGPAKRLPKGEAPGDT